MNNWITLGEQLIMLFLILAAGFLAGTLFDLIRAVKRAMRLSKNFVFLLDVMLCLLAALVVFQIIYLFNQGELRFFVFLAFSLGIAVYYYFCSRHLYKYMQHTLKYKKRVCNKLGVYLYRLRGASSNLSDKREDRG